jgi:4-aminobutyrate aminotransferase
LQVVAGRFVAKSTGGSSMSDDKQGFVPGIVSHVTPVTVDHAAGSWVYGTDGSKWLDFVMGIAVVATGHCHPKVVKAAQAQCEKIIHAQMNMYYHQPMLELSEWLCKTVPGAMDQVLFANSGAEAVENAVKLAKQATRRPVVIGFEGAFHGRTHLTMALTCSKTGYRAHFEPLVGGIFHAHYPYPYRTPASEDPVDYAISDIRRILRAQIMPDDVACIIVEPIQGEGGFVVPPDNFLGEVRKVCDEIGALLIIDEVQAGMGRTGKWFCHEHNGVEADVVTVAKGIASGLPLSAIVSKKAFWDKVTPGTMGGTFGGNAVACAAGVATFKAIEEEGMLANTTRQGEKLRAFWTGKQATYPCIGEVRGKGLMNAIEIVKPGTKEPDAAKAKAFIAEANKRKVILMGAGAFDNCVRFLPALNLNDADLDHAFGVFDEAAKAAFAG